MLEGTVSASTTNTRTQKNLMGLSDSSTVILFNYSLFFACNQKTLEEELSLWNILLLFSQVYYKNFPILREEWQMYVHTNFVRFFKEIYLLDQCLVGSKFWHSRFPVFLFWCFCLLIMMHQWVLLKYAFWFLLCYELVASSWQWSSYVAFM